ncbi:hypothetical protein MJO28_001575 [Puccinia striiformis f. sp. tritici]|uniref:Uncharacterized protein n=1 Tax=Puccinia striiformis f. sp. tritici TaxID=168172 RepID=A0ACC0EVH5_9BASI|nr:hypothetical protein MJO28_001575 [Puccinia striiformis f. sp. tritici]
MFSSKQLITALTLVFLSINAVASMRSQCSEWAHPPNGGLSSSQTKKPIVAKLMSAENEAAHQARSIRRRNTPPGREGATIGGGPTSTCNDQGYDTYATDGVCLWNGDKQKDEVPSYLYAGWLNGGHKENCYRQLWVLGKKLPKHKAWVVDGCMFKEKLDRDTGCATIWVTNMLFKKLGGLPGDETVEIDSWDFNGAWGN